VLSTGLTLDEVMEMHPVAVAAITERTYILNNTKE